MMTFASIIDPLRAANRLSRLPLFSWEIVSLTGAPIELTCGVEIKADGMLDKNDKGDLLVVIAGFGHDQQFTTKNRIALHNCARRYSTVFGVEAGTWLLAKAGVITHHKVTTHWEDIETFSDSYRTLDVSNDRYVIDQNIWTCGGASPALDMMLHYLRDTQNRSLALDVAGVFIYNEANSPADSQVNVSLGRLKKSSPKLAQAISIMEREVEDPIRIADLARQLGVSSKTLETLFQRFLGISPGKYYLRHRLQLARRLALDSNLPVLEIAVRCGFNSQSALSRAFNNRYGQSPLSLRNQSIRANQTMPQI